MGIGANAIPATKYWTFQTGATPEMIKNQDDAVKERRPDIIYSLKSEHDSVIRSYGYDLIYVAADSIPIGTVHVYGKSVNN